MESILFNLNKNMYFKKLKLFQSETLETAQMVKIAEILSSSIVLGKHVFLEGQRGTGKTYILGMIKNVFELESQLFNQTFQDIISKRLGESKEKQQQELNGKNMSRGELNEIFGGNIGNCENGNCSNTKSTSSFSLFGGESEEEKLKKIIQESSIECSKKFEKFNEDELKNEIFKDVDENLKQLYVHIRTNYNNFIFFFIDLSKVSENLINFNNALEANIKLSQTMLYKNKLVFLLDNLSSFDKQGQKEVFLIIKEFSDRGIQFIFTGSKQERKEYETLLGEMLQLNILDLKPLSDQISEEIITSHEGLKKDPGLAQLISENKQEMLSMLNALREKYKKFEPSFSSEIVSDLYNQYQKNKIDQIKNTLVNGGKFKLSNLNLTQIQKFDILGTINKKYQETKVYTSEDKDRDVESIKKVLIGQDQALEGSLNTIFLGKGFNKNPIATLMYLGPTGVGKSELAKQIAKYVFNDENKIKVLQMNTFGDQWTASRLIGSGPGYVGYEDGKTQSLKAVLEELGEGVVLFDEIEKAHSSIYDFIMGMMGDGKVQMASGLGSEHELSFKNFVLIFTSNAITSYDELKSDNSKIGFNTGLDKNEDKELDLNSGDVKEKVIRVLKDTFKPEFLGRIDQFFLFNELTDESMKTILKNYIEKTKEKLKSGIKDGYSPFKESDIDAFLFFDDQELDDIILYARKTKLGARNAIKKCEEVISEKMNFHFSGKKPMGSYKIVDNDTESNDHGEDKKRGRKRKEDKEKIING